MEKQVLHCADFEPYLNRSFTIWIEEGQGVIAELINADVLTKTSSLEDSPREPFSLVFKLKDGAELGQRMYDLSCGKAVWPDVFLVPIHVPRNGRFVQAIFN